MIKLAVLYKVELPANLKSIDEPKINESKVKPAIDGSSPMFSRMNTNATAGNSGGQAASKPVSEVMLESTDSGLEFNNLWTKNTQIFKS